MPVVPAVSLDDIRRQISEKSLAPVYFLYGEEPYFIDLLTDAFATEVLPPEQWDFNRHILYGKDVDGPTVVNMARRAPLMAHRMLVIVREAQQMKRPEALVEYVKTPVPSTVLVLAYKTDSTKKLDRRTAFYKALHKHAQVFESKPMKEWEARKWVRTYVERKGGNISAEAAAVVVDYLGTQLKLITQYLDRILDLSEAKNITPADVHEQMGTHREFNIYELLRALSDTADARALHIAEQIGLSRTITYLLPFYLSTLYQHYARARLMHAAPDAWQTLKIPRWAVDQYRALIRRYTPEQLENILTLIHHYERISKGMEGLRMRPDEVLKECVLRIVHS